MIPLLLLAFWLSGFAVGLGAGRLFHLRRKARPLLQLPVEKST